MTARTTSAQRELLSVPGAPTTSRQTATASLEIISLSASVVLPEGPADEGLRNAPIRLADDGPREHARRAAQDPEYRA